MEFLSLPAFGFLFRIFDILNHGDITLSSTNNKGYHIWWDPVDSVIWIQIAPTLMGSTTSLIILAKKGYSSGRLRYQVQVRRDPFCFRYNQDHGLRQLQRQDHRRSQLLAGAGGSYFKFCDTITEIQLLELLARVLAKIRVDLDHCEWPVKYLISILQVNLLKR